MNYLKTAGKISKRMVAKSLTIPVKSSKKAAKAQPKAGDAKSKPRAGGKPSRP